MKKLLLLPIVAILSAASLWGAQAQNSRTVTLDLRQASAAKVLDALKTATSYEFFYRLNDIEDVPLRDYTFTDATLSQVMDMLTQGTAVQWSLREQTVIISRRANARQQQATGVISGKVVDEAGNPLAGATVLLVGTGRATSADANGEFRFDRVAGQTATVDVSFVGMVDTRQTLTAGQHATIALRPDSMNVGEVVVTGLFDRPGESFTGSARTIRPDELRRVGSGNLFQSLRNIDPSLNFIDNMELGSDPNAMPDIELRGTTSFPLSEEDLDMRRTYQSNPNQPLFILNGFETSVQRIFDLDMERVESVTILKDAAAKAIYGAKAANGVVVINTKRRTGGDMVLAYRGSVDIEMPDLTSYDLTNSIEKLQVERLSGIYDNEQLSFDMSNEQLYNQRMNAALSGVNTDWLSKPLRTGIGTKHSVAAEISEGALSLLADLSYNNVAGVMKESKRNTIGGNMEVQYRRNKFLVSNAMSLTSNKATDSPYGSFQEYANMNPYNAPYDESGNLVKSFSGIRSGQGNPLWNARLNTSLTSNYLNFADNFTAEYRPFDGIILRLRLGIETQRSESDSFYPGGHTMFDSYTSEEDVLRKGSYTHAVGRMDRLSGDFAFQYNKSFGDHLIMSNFMYSMSESTSHELTYVGEGFPSGNMGDMMFARRYAMDSAPTGWESIVRDIAFTGLVGYSYDNRYMADFTIRGSASSQYSPEKRWGAFWSVGLAWNMHNERWSPAWLEQFKLRASIGTTGNQGIESYAHMVTYKYHTDKFYNSRRKYPGAGEGTNMGAYIMRMANRDLRWEQELANNVGFDARVGKRLTLVFDAYLNHITDKVIDFTLAPSTGYSSTKENVGKIENKGIDLMLSYRLIDRREFYVNVTGAASMDSNEIQELSDAMRAYNKRQDEIVDDNTEGGRWRPVLRYVEGGSMNAIWAVPSLGINPQNGREIYVRPDGSTTYDYSSVYQQAVGDMRDKIRGNFGVNGEYKGVGWNVVFRFMAGGDYYNSTLVTKVENANVNNNVDRRVFLGRWSADNRTAPFKRLEPYIDANGNYVEIPFTQPTSRFVQERNELDIAAVSLYYDIARIRAVENAGFKRLRLGFNMNDIHKFSSIAVERGTAYPFSRTMSFSLTAEF